MFQHYLCLWRVFRPGYPGSLQAGQAVPGSMVTRKHRPRPDESSSVVSREQRAGAIRRFPGLPSTPSSKVTAPGSLVNMNTNRFALGALLYFTILLEGFLSVLLQTTCTSLFLKYLELLRKVFAMRMSRTN